MTVGPAAVTEAERRLRRDALACHRAALAAVEPAALTRAALARLAPDLSPDGRLLVAALGKAAAAMMRGALAVLGSRIAHGLVIGPPAPPDEPAFPADRVLRLAASHPLPDRSSAAAGRALLALAGDADRDDLLLVLLSGGASALATVPAAGLSLDDLAAATAALLEAGAPIAELNAVRRHLDAVKGGRLARAAAPARVLGLILSDVIGDAPDVIASGPLSPDASTFADALAVLDRRRARVPAAVRAFLERGAAGLEPETPERGDPCFDEVRLEVIAGNRTAVEAAAARARALGRDAIVPERPVEGEAREAGAALAGWARGLAPGQALVAGGETVVTVRGAGRGGRCQELALAAALELDGTGVVLLSAATDGVDGPTDAAGAFATGTTLARAASLGLDARAALDRNDAHTFFAALGDLLVTGPTGTNVADLVIAMVMPEVPPPGVAEREIGRM